MNIAINYASTQFRYARSLAWPDLTPHFYPYRLQY